MKPKISHATLNAIRRELLAQKTESADWLSYSAELQDDSTFLLVSVEMPEAISAKRYRDACREIRRIIGNKIAPRHDEYSWMGVIVVNGDVVESIVSELLVDP